MSIHNRRTASLIIGVGLWLTACFPLPVGAANGFRPRIATQTQISGDKVTGTLTVNDKTAAVFKAVWGGHNPEVRANLVADRLQTLIAHGLAPGTVTARRLTSKNWEIAAGLQSILLVSPEEAGAHRMSVAALAKSWAGTLRRLLAEPPLAVSTAGLTIPYGETRLVTVSGAARTADIVVQDSDARLSHADFVPATHTLIIHALATGRGAVTVQAEDAQVSIPIVVMKYAAAVSPAVTISVTGEPASSDVVIQAIYAGLAKAVNAEDGAHMHVEGTPRITGTLAPEEYITVPIFLRVAGANLLPVETKSTVTVVNTPVVPRPATALFYSNNPEQLKRGGSLFTGSLQPFKPVRLDYHHQNVSTSSLVFHADLVNDSSIPAAVQVISGISLPGSDTVQVGRRAGAGFLRALDGNIGLVLDIPPHARVPLVTQRIAPGLTVSGIVQLQQIGGAGDAVRLTVAADGDDSALVSPVARVILAALPESRAAAPLPDMPSNTIEAPLQSPYVFGPPQFLLTGSYSVGGKWAYVQIGQTEALKDATGKLTLWGNYGADYHLTLTLTNPTTTAKAVAVFFAPDAGSTAGVFRVDGGPIQEIDPTPPPQEPQIAKYTLEPGETRTVRIETIPLNGSSYPASIIVHAL